MVNNLVLGGQKPLFLMVLGAHGYHKAYLNLSVPNGQAAIALVSQVPILADRAATELRHG